MDVTKNGTWAVDREASSAEFSVRFLTVTRTSGGFGEVAGGIRFDGEDLSGASVEATIQVSSVRTGDETRDEHIRERGDFFEAGAFPEISFESTRVEPSGEGGLMRIVCDLTIRDVTRAVVLGARYGGTTIDGAGTRRVNVRRPDRDQAHGLRPRLGRDGGTRGDRGHRLRQYTP